MKPLWPVRIQSKVDRYSQKLALFTDFGKTK